MYRAYPPSRQTQGHIGGGVGKFNRQWMLQNIRETTTGSYTEPLYSGRDATKNYPDTGELTGLPTARVLEGASMELGDISQVCDVDENTEEGVGENVDADGAGQQRWGTTMGGLTPSARYAQGLCLSPVIVHQHRCLNIVLQL